MRESPVSPLGEALALPAVRSPHRRAPPRGSPGGIAQGPAGPLQIFRPVHVEEGLELRVVVPQLRFPHFQGSDPLEQVPDPQMSPGDLLLEAAQDRHSVHGAERLVPRRPPGDDHLPPRTSVVQVKKERRFQ